jgi:hypothetical protein
MNRIAQQLLEYIPDPDNPDQPFMQHAMQGFAIQFADGKYANRSMGPTTSPAMLRIWTREDQAVAAAKGYSGGSRPVPGSSDWKVVPIVIQFG